MDIRPATIDDAALIFEWRNDPQSRAMFRDSTPVDWTVHTSWLSDTLQRPDRRLFVASDASGPVGVVRFDRDDRAWAVSINLAPARRGQGLSLDILLTAMRQLPGQSFRAEIKPANAPSRRLFARAGFTETGQHDGMICMENKTGTAESSDPAAAAGGERPAPAIVVMHLITSLQVGGAERMLEKLVTGMDRTAFINVVVSLRGLGPIGRALHEQGIVVHALNIRTLFGLPGALWRLFRLILQYQPQILQSWLYHADLLAMAAHILAPRTRLLWNIRCSDMNLADYSIGTRLVLRLLALASPLPDLVISNSETGRSYHDAIGYRARRWAIIPNGFDLDRFRPDPQASGMLRASLGLPRDVRLAGMVARFDPMKDHASFIAMAEQLQASLPDLHILLAGRGCDGSNPLLAAAAERAGGRLHLLGPREDIAAILPGLDLVVLSSAYGEGFPNVLGEALACGTPCLGTNVGDVATIIGDCGAVVPPRQPALLAAAAARLLELPPADRQAMRQRARRRAEQNFALPVIVARYESLYREAAGNRRD